MTYLFTVTFEQKRNLENVIVASLEAPDENTARRAASRSLSNHPKIASIFDWHVRGVYCEEMVRTGTKRAM